MFVLGNGLRRGAGRVCGSASGRGGGSGGRSRVPARLGLASVPPAAEAGRPVRSASLRPSAPFPRGPGVEARLGRGRAGLLRLAGTAPGAPGAAAPQLLGTAASLPARRGAARRGAERHWVAGLRFCRRRWVGLTAAGGGLALVSPALTRQSPRSLAGSQSGPRPPGLRLRGELRCFPKPTTRALSSRPW